MLITAEELARLFHREYEAAAPLHGWETQERSRKKWEDVPPENKSLMIAVADKVLAELRVNEMREALLGLTTIGDEEWKTPGHPMNDWVKKDTVHARAKRALGFK